MFGSIGPQELLLILGLALIVFGPRKLPEIGKTMGKMMAEFRKASSDFKRTIEEEVEAEKRPPTLPVPPEPVVAEPVVTPASENVSQSSPDVPADTPVSDATPELGHAGTPRS
jgi:TatA/E family protein of Tat protein translocase